jgi:hypothetical protein
VWQRKEGRKGGRERSKKGERDRQAEGRRKMLTGIPWGGNFLMPVKSQSMIYFAFCLIISVMEISPSTSGTVVIHLFC